jgi:hypothetical protein
MVLSAMVLCLRALEGNVCQILHLLPYHWMLYRWMLSMLALALEPSALSVFESGALWHCGALAAPINPILSL